MRDVRKPRRRRLNRATTSAATNATRANLNRQQPTLWKNGAKNLKNGAKDKGNEMKNWLIEKLGGVPKPIYDNVVGRYFHKSGELATENEKVIYLKAEKAEIEEAGKEMSERISELVDKLNEERKVSNGLMARMTAKTLKIEELQAEIEAKNAELARVKSEIIAISKIKADTTLKAENQRLKAELELLKRRKGKK